MHNKESYEDTIWDVLEDSMELSEETKKHIKQAEIEIMKGKTVPLAHIKKNQDYKMYSIEFSITAQKQINHFCNRSWAQK